MISISCSAAAMALASTTWLCPAGPSIHPGVTLDSSATSASPTGGEVATRLDWPACATDASCLFTRGDLARFTGVGRQAAWDPETLLVSLVSYVFNVTSAPHFYRAGLGSYSYLAGTDGSRVLATMSMSEEDVRSHNLADLTDDQWEELFSWIDKYQAKYPLVGRLLNWSPGVTIEAINARSGFSLTQPPVPPAQRGGGAEL